MRPHRLRLRAFGPFVDEVELDLDALAAGGLFLLHGETGAGKTTLLDALGFALFGRVPGARGKAGRLRSDAADPGVRTEVELEVTLADRRWRITRSPAQERPKARGTGTTTEQARVHIEERRGDRWESVSTRLDEAGAELDRLLGMSAEQFFQVVLLPQGEFARFLRADSKDRGELLERLFATERFGAVEDWLAARRVSTASAVAAVRQELEVLHARVAQAAGVELPESPDLSWVADLVADAGAALSSASSLSASAAAARDAAREQAAAVQRVAALQQRRAGLLAEASDLAAGAAERERLRAELGGAARAAELAGLLDDAAARKRAARRAADGEAAARAALAGVGLAVDLGVPALRAAVDAAGRRTGELEQLQAVADDLAQERAAASRADIERADASRDLDRVGAALAALPAQRTAAEAAQRRAAEASAALPAAREAVGRLEALRGEAAALTTATRRAAQLREELLLARETWVSLKAKENELREARLVTMLAELAGRLVDGAPCEVCGSTSHPDPYEGAGEGVTRDDEERARLAADDAARVVADLEAQLAAQDAVALGARERLGAQDPAALPALLAEAAGVVEGLEQRAAGLAAAQRSLTALAEHEAALGAAQAGTTAALAAADQRAAEAAEREVRLAARLAAALDGSTDLAAALAAVAARASVAERSADAAAEAERAVVEQDRAERAAADAAGAAGFADVAAAAAARRDVAWRADAERQLREADDRSAAVAAGLTDPELADLPDEPADVAAARAALAAADAAADAAASDEAGCASRLAALTALQPQVAERTGALAPLEQAAGVARRMADLCGGGGGNALKMRLTSFVLAARLEEVAAAASVRLLRMTQGRYALRHTDGAARGGARSGLGLLACDAWTGQDRDTATLSGGETFLASLALALGLADVVQAEAGGARLEALFVDEGFGTLDEDTLDEVMDVLDGLREGGRVVALVSHVAELRTRIPAQVRVVKGRAGSRVELLGV